MVPTCFSRRKFFSIGAAGLLSLAFRFNLPQKRIFPLAIGRVATPLIYIYDQPAFQSERKGKKTRDTLINLLEEVESKEGPAYNPRWYRIAEGYIHSGHVQRIETRPANDPLTIIPEEGVWGEVTVPFTRSFYRGNDNLWSPLYRLYYESVHWVKGVSETKDGTYWYRLFDPKNDSTYYVPASELRIISPSEYSPIVSSATPKDKRVVVSIENQTLTAYEGERIVLNTKISSGVPEQEPLQENEPPTDTPKGSWRIQLKTPSRHMGNGRLTSQIDAYELPGVPWTMGFHKDGYALHGSYWHDNFGRQMSHGCINMRNQDALWLFRWTEPVYESKDWYVQGLGTLIIII